MLVELSLVQILCAIREGGSGMVLLKREVQQGVPFKSYLALGYFGKCPARWAGALEKWGGFSAIRAVSRLPMALGPESVVLGLW